MVTQPDCSRDEGSWCARIYHLTQNNLLSRYADTVVGTGLRILLIVMLAVLIRLMVHRTITRLIQVSAEGSRPGLLWQRRSQRTRTIGSVLRSGTTFVVYGVACTLVLGELGINLGRSSPQPASWASRWASARRTWSRTSCPECS